MLETKPKKTRLTLDLNNADRALLAEVEERWDAGSQANALRRMIRLCHGIDVRYGDRVHVSAPDKKEDPRFEGLVIF